MIRTTLPVPFNRCTPIWKQLRESSTQSTHITISPATPKQHVPRKSSAPNPAPGLLVVGHRFVCMTRSTAYKCMCRKTSSPSHSHNVPCRHSDSVPCHRHACMCSQSVVAHACTWLAAANHGVCRKSPRTRQEKKVNTSMWNPKVFSS
jgi:hypothetical protein